MNYHYISQKFDAKPCNDCLEQTQTSTARFICNLDL